MRRPPRRSPKLICSINMAAFLSIQLALLFIMMPPSPHAFRHIDVNLAQVEHPVPMRWALRDDATVVAIKRDGRVYVGHDEANPDYLSAIIRKSLGRGGEQKVYINADRRTRYKDVREAVAAVRSAGVEDIGFLVTDAKRY